MKPFDMRRMSGATAAAGALSLAARAGAAQPPRGQSGGMMGGMMGGMNRGWMGGYGGPWVVILLVVIAGLVVWMIARGRNKR